MRSTTYRVALLATILSLASPATWAEGSLAIDSNQGPSYGFSYNYKTVGEADRKAVADCGSNCSVVRNFSGECAAYAADQSSGSTVYGWGTASTSGAAQNTAMRECSERGGTSCRVRAWGCDRR